jgi:hypothetical protein
MVAPLDLLESRIAETVMAALMPCDLGDGIEVIHDVETLEITMDCDLRAPEEEDLCTQQFVRFSAPYERIELQLDPGGFRRAAIEDARKRGASLPARS